MKKAVLLFGLILGVVSIVFSQTTSLDNYTGTWENSASWAGGVAPPVADPANLTSSDLDLTINGYITRTGDVNLPMNTPTKNFVINDTLVILGDFTFPNDAAELIIGPDAVLIVMGNVSFGNNTRVTNSGIFAVSGNITFAPGDTDVYDDSGGGELFVQGTVSLNPAAEGSDNWGNLDTLYPEIYEFMQCGGFPPCILPIKLSYFSAKKLGHRVQLEWATTMEENFQMFVIQRCADGLSFEDIGEVPGQGFNIYDIESRYTFEDDAPLLGMNYYRLKAVDLDNSYEYSDVKAVKVNGPKKIGVFPNPSNGEVISFQPNFNPEESDRVSLVDQLGVEIYSGTAASIKNTITLQNALKPGVYLLRYVSRDFEQVSRVVVTH